MKAWTLIRHGAIERAFELHEHPDPRPHDHQVLIRCEGFGLNYADVMATRGLYRDAPPLPSILGYEVVGRIEAVGNQVATSMIGKRVTALTRFGGYAEFAVTDHRACAEVPDELPLGMAAALATQGATAWYAARMLCPMRHGERVLVHSAAGGVGHLIAQLAVHAGCEVFAVVSGQEKCGFMQQLGATHAVDRRAGDYADRVRALLEGERIDVSFNAVGGSSFRRDMGLLGTGGRIVLYGGAERGSTSTLGFIWRMGFIVPIFLMMKSRSVLGVNMLHLSDRRPDVIAECLRGVVDAHASGLLAPRVQETYEAKHLPDALAALASGRTLGKVAVRW